MNHQLTHRQLVLNAYDKVALKYLRDRAGFSSNKYLKKFLKILPKAASILDLGCGAGVPVDDLLIKNNHLVTGLDISRRQIDLARKKCPRGFFQVADVARLQPKQYQADAVVCLYTIFHLPREQHLEFLQTINSFLPISGPILISMGEKDFEGVHDFYGQKIWSSQYGPERNLELLNQAGFEIDLDEIDHRGREEHQIIIAHKLKEIC
ncbi:MAG: class I SAM-dependent methyltransferase [Patescibacteria group bacterium]